MCCINLEQFGCRPSGPVLANLRLHVNDVMTFRRNYGANYTDSENKTVITVVYGHFRDGNLQAIFLVTTVISHILV